MVFCEEYMSSSRSDVDGTLLSRYECKYFVSEQVASRVRAFMKPFLTLDDFSARSDDMRYPVYSMYFDSPGLRLYQDTVEGSRNRYKLRFRYYEEFGDGPVFCEVKKRNDLIVRKARDRVSREDARAILRGEAVPANNEFLQRARELGAGPAMRIRYKREAWECRGNSPVRITFDTDLHHCVMSSLELGESLPNWIRTPVDGVILEVKFTERRPMWLQELVRQFQLDKESIPKYVMSVDHTRETGEFEQRLAKLAVTPVWRHAAS